MPKSILEKAVLSFTRSNAFASGTAVRKFVAFLQETRE